LVTLRCTAKLLNRLRVPIGDAVPSGRLGDWYARTIAGGPRHVALCTNERSLLCVVVPLAPMSELLARFAVAVKRRIDQVPAPLTARRAEHDALSSTQFGRSVSRSVISTMNQFMYSAESWLAEQPNGNLEELGFWLCDTPCAAISTHWPWLEAELLLTGTVAPGRRPLKAPVHVL
jgi:hypothetical protein